MVKLLKITFIRHTSLNIESHLCYGQTDVDVSLSFDREQKTLKAKLDKYVFDAIYSSPLQRCVKLAHALNIGDPIQDHRLKELHFGDWEMKSWDDIPREHFNSWIKDYANLAPPNGETFYDLQQRGIAFLNDMKETHRNEHIAVVSHGGMIRAVLAHALDIPLKSLFRFNIDYASITTFDFSKTIPKVNYVNQ